VIWALGAATTYYVSAMASQVFLLLSCAGLLVLLFQAHQVQRSLTQQIADFALNESILRAQANHDSLTGLANRLLLADRFKFTAERSKRNRVAFALLMIDLNNFKSVNDRFGHAAGDHVLATQAGRLLTCVRSSDTVARLGGDEFVVLVESFENPDEMVHIGRKLIACLSEPIALEGGNMAYVGASVGIALYPKDGEELSELLNVADRGMYDCKASGLMEMS
jgi:diguanylate cyclase (GGDEF)-like protein